MVEQSLMAAELLKEQGKASVARREPAHHQAAGSRSWLCPLRSKVQARLSRRRSTASSAVWATRWPTCWWATANITFTKIGVEDQFGQSGKAMDVLRAYDLCADQIAARIAAKI